MTLSDNEINAEINAGRLILNADRKLIEGACYQLRMGGVYYDLTESGKRFELNSNQSVLIKPGHRTVLITAEEFDVPEDILVRVVSKGSLFSIGLSPVATYADPGFSGNLGIVTENTSDKYIVIPQGEPIAKADFTRLSSAATKLYKGQHGFQAGIWPIKTHLQKEHGDVVGDPRVGSEKDEAFALLPAATRTVIRRIEQTHLLTIGGLFVAILINSSVLFLIDNKFMDNVYGVIGNIVSTVIIGVAVLFGNFFRRNT
ncbi:dCTP deaminase domain-containing protein [Xanthobacter autotrophicus]|uniref:dCTP deaminase domain-containing protein n=1 Tax=Xanthobacter autotrophicus TaxID=280 RepID=UPI0024A61331|nr:hypothetical protein [Xanthobacter autotrophicus]MDI4658007.1 hypothetical protein [Xanthobacter autotrophicus]